MAATCGSMKKGEVYACKDCGFEIEVVKECDCDADEVCQPGHDHCCEFECCGKPMEKK